MAGRSQPQEFKATGHIASTVMKQRAVKANAQSSLGDDATHSGEVFLLQVT